MATFLQQTQFVHNLARNLLLSKHNYYQEQYIRYKLIQNPLYSHHTVYVKNGFEEKLKVSVFICANNENSEGQYNGKDIGKDKIRKSQKYRAEGQDRYGQVCIVYLHGLGSHRLQGTCILNACQNENGIGLCCFDFSGSGKSQGEICTYGQKQHQDIEYVLKMLKEKFQFKKFVLWGRSMGATASLLYTCSDKKDHNFNTKINTKSSSPITTLSSNSNTPSYTALTNSFLKQCVLFQVIDSPFSTFSSIAKYHAHKTYHFPDVFVNFALSILQQHYKNNQFDPFKIDIPAIISQCQIPTLFMYSQDDVIIPAYNSVEIIQKFNPNTLYEKLIITQNHNNFRTNDTLHKVMQIVRKYIQQNKIKQKIKYKKGIRQLYSIKQNSTNTKIQKQFTRTKQQKQHRQPSKQIKIMNLSGFGIQKRRKGRIKSIRRLHSLEKSKEIQKDLIKDIYKEKKRNMINNNPQTNGFIKYTFKICGRCTKVEQ